MSPIRPQQARKPAQRRSRGQVVVIFGLVLTVLMAFVGLALDAGSLYISYAHLKRAVDAAAVAAANQFKRNDSTETYSDRVKHIKSAAIETIALQGIDVKTTAANPINIKVYICDEDGDGYRDASLATANPQFYATCPDTNPTVATAPLARKLVWIQATQWAPLYFLQLIGARAAPLTTNSIGEAAPLDLLIVLDTSMSMGRDTPGYHWDNYDPYATPPTGCNADNSCQPLQDTKTAAIGLVNTLFEGYDRAAIVTFDLYARASSGDFETSKTAIDADINNVKLHADAPMAKIWPWWRSDNTPGNVLFNPSNPEDWSGDGADADVFASATGLNYGSPCPDILDAAESGTNTTFDIYKFRWWHENVNPMPSNPPATWGLPAINYGGAPCDRGDKFDSFNWTNSATGYDPDATSGTDISIRNWLVSSSNGNQTALQHYLPSLTPPISAAAITSGVAHDRAARLLSTVTTCTGCGIRVASDFFKAHGRRNAVWVMVFLSDGVANATDIPVENPSVFYYPEPTASNPTPTFTWNIGQYYQNGFCAGTPGQPLWLDDVNQNALCVDKNPPKSSSDTTNTRYCVDKNSDALGNPINTCPPNSVHLDQAALATMGNRIKYGPYQYAMDMIDGMALTVNSTSDASKASKYNTSEPKGNTIAVYTIAFGTGATTTIYNTAMGVNLLRYMAAVGDDGDRVTDPCSSVADPTQPCGNYYYAPNASELIGVFEDIAKRIQTRISY